MADGSARRDGVNLCADLGRWVIHRQSKSSDAKAGLGRVVRHQQMSMSKWVGS